MLGAVVDGMETPQERDLVGPAMAPVEPISPTTIPAAARSHSGHAATAAVRRCGTPRWTPQATRRVAPRAPGQPPDRKESNSRDRWRRPCGRPSADAARTGAPAAGRSRRAAAATPKAGDVDQERLEMVVQEHRQDPYPDWPGGTSRPGEKRIPPGRASRNRSQTLSVRLASRRRPTTPRPSSPTPSSDSAAGSGTTAGELTPARNTVGGIVVCRCPRQEATRLEPWPKVTDLSQPNALRGSSQRCIPTSAL